LWLTVAFPATWATLWLFERLLFAGVFSVEIAGSIWFYGVWMVVAVVAGNVVAYVCDRVFVRQRARLRPLGGAADGTPAS
jgi:hypothetical protein